ncbi:MAG: type I phosphomannose isomerase catalytic subunit [Phycisphaerales bacterium]
MSAPETSPLLFEPILKAKVWGGRRLARYGKKLPQGQMIGESWEIADLGETSVSGGGGGEARSRIASGPLQGRTLHEAIQLWGARLLGERVLHNERVRQETGMPEFPLLVKFLDAREHLSVQVHPSPEYAETHEDAHLKTESWLIVEAEPGSVIFKGLREGVGPDRLLQAIKSGSVPDVLRAIPAVVGECHTLASGTVHALGAGVLVAEVQTPSDTTFRLYDWTSEYDRPERELHLAEALACVDYGRAPSAGVREPGVTQAVVAETEFYRLRSARLEHRERLGVDVPDAPVVVMSVGGESGFSAIWRGETTQVPLGSTVLIPAELSGECELAAWDAPAEVLIAEVL